MKFKTEWMENVPVDYGQVVSCDIWFTIGYTLHKGDNVTPSSIDINEVQVIKVLGYTEKNQLTEVWGWNCIPEDIQGIVEDYVDSRYQDIIWS